MDQSFWLRRWWYILALIIALYLSLAAGRALTSQPWDDEAWYASPSLSLIQHGNTGTPFLETAGKFWKGIHERTYWVAPLQFFVQVPWFKLFGFSLWSGRFLAVSWGLVALIAWGLIVHRLTKSAAMGFVTMLFIGCDYQFASQTALARMDAMALAFSSLAILFYLEFRERNLSWAVFTSQLAVVGCGLTHPMPGVPAFVALLFLTLYLDRRRIRLVHFGIAVIPYLLGAAFWGWYISPAPDLFRAQFFGNVTDMDRLGGFAHPLRALIREASRYAGMAGFLPGMHPLYRIRIGIVLLYGVGVAGLLANPSVRRNSGIRTLLWLWTVYFLCMVFYDDTKEVKYAFHIIALYDAVLAVWVVSWWQQGKTKQLAAAVCAALYLTISIGGLLYTSLVKKDYQNSFLPAAMFLKRHAAPGDLILASSEFGFPLGFDRNIVDDDSFTYHSHKVPEFIVIGKGYQDELAHCRVVHPEIFNYFVERLNRDYELIYSKAGYQIFERRDRPSG